MNPRFRGPALAILLCGLALACSSAPEETGGPVQTLEQFYSHLTDGNYSDAISLYGAEALGIVRDPQGGVDPGFAEWAGQETRRGQVDEIKVIQEQTEGERATIEYEVVYKDGTSKQGTVTLTFEEGLWKLGLIG